MYTGGLGAGWLLMTVIRDWLLDQEEAEGETFEERFD
jgi:hypothetical protein